MSVTTSVGEPHGAVTVSVNDGQGSLIDILYDADGQAAITKAWVSFRGAAHACDHDELTRAVRTLLRSRGLLPTTKGQDRMTSRLKSPAAFCRSILEDPDYRASLVARAKNHTLPPEIEEMIWRYAYEPPRRVVRVARPAPAPPTALSLVKTRATK